MEGLRAVDLVNLRSYCAREFLSREKLRYFTFKNSRKAGIRPLRRHFVNPKCYVIKCLTPVVVTLERGLVPR